MVFVSDFTATSPALRGLLLLLLLLLLSLLLELPSSCSLSAMRGDDAGQPLPLDDFVRSDVVLADTASSPEDGVSSQRLMGEDDAMSPFPTQKERKKERLQEAERMRGRKPFA